MEPIKVKLKWIGAPGQYVQGYKPADMEVGPKIAEGLIETGLYELVPNKPKRKRRKKEVTDG